MRKIAKAQITAPLNATITNQNEARHVLDIQCFLSLLPNLWGMFENDSPVFVVSRVTETEMCKDVQILPQTLITACQ